MLPFFRVEHFFHCPLTCVLVYEMELREPTCVFHRDVKSFARLWIIIIIFLLKSFSIKAAENQSHSCLVHSAPVGLLEQPTVCLFPSCWTLYFNATDCFFLLVLHSHMCVTKSCGQWPWCPPPEILQDYTATVSLGNIIPQSDDGNETPTTFPFFIKTRSGDMTAVSGEILNPSFALIDIMNGMCFQPP